MFVFSRTIWTYGVFLSLWLWEWQAENQFVLILCLSSCQLTFVSCRSKRRWLSSCSSYFSVCQLPNPTSLRIRCPCVIRGKVDGFSTFGFFIFSLSSFLYTNWYFKLRSLLSSSPEYQRYHHHIPWQTLFPLHTRAKILKRSQSLNGCPLRL